MNIESALDSSSSNSSTSRVSCNNKPPEYQQQMKRPLYPADSRRNGPNIQQTADETALISSRQQTKRPLYAAEVTIMTG